MNGEINLENLSDIHLVNLTLDNQKEAFIVLYERHLGDIHEFVQYVLESKPEMIESVVTKTFIAAYKTLGSHNPQLPFIFFLYRIALNIFVKTLSGKLVAYRQKSNFFFRQIKHFSLYQMSQIYKSSVTMAFIYSRFLSRKSRLSNTVPLTDVVENITTEIVVHETQGEDHPPQNKLPQAKLRKSIIF